MNFYFSTKNNDIRAIIYIDNCFMNISLEIVDYKPEYQPWFEKFNRDWIEKYFWMEPLDVEILQNPDKHIINEKGYIIMATLDKEMAGTVALKYTSQNVYELTKMAVDEKFRGQKIGEALAQAAIKKAKSLGANKIILYSSTKLKPALALYRKLGFVEVAVDGPYKRSDVKMELLLHKNIPSPFEIEIRKAIKADAKLLRDLSEQTFRETFAEHNTDEDMKLYTDQNFKIQRLNDELNEEQSSFFIAFHGDAVLGYAKIRVGHEPKELKGNAIEIERLYATKVNIGKGVGKKLIEKAFEEGKRKGLSTAWLGVWEHNTRAIAFYEKLGFKKFGAHTFMLGTDAQTDWLMKKD
jgi:ribosomal protein S18 acetylase RimI-like enzyme